MSAGRLCAVLFDLDGTLLDTAPDFATVTNRLLAEHGRAPLPYAAIRCAVSSGSRALVELAFGIPEADPGFAPLRARLLELYAANLLVDTAPFPGIEALLGALGERGIAWGVVTNKPSWLAGPLLEAAALSPPHAVLVCPDHVSRTKPDPEPLYLACAQLRCNVADAVYVGDHRRDIEAGRRAGMRTVAVRYGYIGEHDSADSWQADHVVDDCAGLQRLLLGELIGD